MPELPVDLWDVLLAFGDDERHALFAHCISLSLNAVHEAYNRRPRAMAHADRLAEDIGLDMVAAGWEPTVGNYLGRVTKARILLAVREAKGDKAAETIAPLKKMPMAELAQGLLAGSRWLPEPLRTRGGSIGIGDDESSGEPLSTDSVEETGAIGGECRGDDEAQAAENDNVGDEEVIAAE